MLLVQNFGSSDLSRLYGSSRAIATFSGFGRLGALTKTEAQKAAFVEMVSVMRTDSGGELALSQDIQTVLMGSQEEKQQMEP
ncbi:MAG: hypothetical protein ABIV21_04740 [Pyrinomonadaceae bacterium]